MRLVKSLSSSIGKLLMKCAVWIASIALLLFLIGYPLYESYHDNRLLTECKQETGAAKCKLMKVAVPD
jgi:hypothetical protein